MINVKTGLILRLERNKMTTEINNGGPAFPFNADHDGFYVPGMSLRAYVAVHALNQAVLDYGQPNLGSAATAAALSCPTPRSPSGRAKKSSQCRP